MIVKRKLFSFIDEDGNQGYYLYNESTGEEKLFSVVEEEREFARGVGQAVKAATQFMQTKGQGAINKAAKKAMEASTPIGTMGIKDPRVFRRVNSPMAMNNATWAKDMGANKLHTNISRRAGNKYLGSLAGTSGKTSWTGGTIVGGGYAV